MNGDYFYGTFDGAGHTINSLYINLPDTDEVGLFGQLNGASAAVKKSAADGFSTAPGGSVTNLNLTTVNISGRNGVGALAGSNEGARIDNVNVSLASVSGQLEIGGFFGRDATGHVDGDGNPIFSISNSSFAGDVHSDTSYAGGIVANSYGNYFNVTTSGSVVAAGGAHAGGIIGYQEQGALLSHGSSSSVVRAIAGLNAGGLVGYLAGTVEWSDAHGHVDGSGSIGGAAGAIESDGIIRDSYATGAISGDFIIGGFVGHNDGEISDSYSSGNVEGVIAIGGFAGINNSTITNAYSLGNVDAFQSNSAQIGGFIGANSGSVMNAYSSGAAVSNGKAPSVGAFIGELDGGTILDGYYDISINSFGPDRIPLARVGANNTGVKLRGVHGVSSGATAYLASSYNFLTTAPDHWVILDGETRPMLAMEYSTTITNAHQLQLMGLDPTAHYTLANDINLMGVLANRSEVWNHKTKFAPIGLDKDGNLTAFTGEFSGASHTINGLSIVSSLSGVGLIGELSGSLHDLSLTNVAVTDTVGNSIGAAVGWNYGGTIFNVRSSGTVHGGAGGLSVGRSGWQQRRDDDARFIVSNS
jgi:hypothetical protein